MTVPRKLNQDLERQVALAYLCGVGIGYLTQRYGVSDATVRNNIVARRSLEWQDRLVEFYRQTKPHDKVRNAIHLYLTFNGQGEGLRNVDLVDTERDRPIYEAVEGDIFTPRTKKLIEETNLERILRVPEPVPISKGERLLRAIFGEADTYKQGLGLITPLLYQKLMQAYQQDRRVNIDDIYAQVANEIYLMLKRGLVAIEVLPKRGEEIPALRERFEGVFENVGQDFAATRERIREIEVKALRKLRHPSRSRRHRGFLET